MVINSGTREQAAIDRQERINEREADQLVRGRIHFTCIDCNGNGKRFGTSEDDVCAPCEGSGVI